VRFRTLLLALACPLAVTPALAGRPLTTEDASVLGDKACQLEAWVDRASETTQAWLVPACNFGLGIEWQVGFSRAWEGGRSYLPEAYAQAKGLFREMNDESPWGVGWVVGVVRQPTNETYRGWENPYVLLPVSVAGGDFTLHVQPGWSRERESGSDRFVWGVAGEYAANERVALVAETFGVDREKPFVRAGLRWSAIKDRLDFDLTYVTRPGGTREERLVSLGLAWQSGAFLP
jgi:hypothetical protein